VEPEVPAAPLPPPPVAAAPAAAPAPEPAAAPASSSVDWSSWDGRLDSLPETERDRYKPMYEHFDSRVKSLSKEAQEARDTFDRFMQGLGDDPRLGEVEAAKKQLADELGLTKKEVERLMNDHKLLQSEYEAYRAEQAAVELDRLFAKHAEQAKDPKWGESLLEALKAEWDVEDAARFASLPADVQDAARVAMNKGADPAVALEYAELKAAQRAKAPRVQPESVEVVAGAHSARVSPPEVVSTKGLNRGQLLELRLRGKA